MRPLYRRANHKINLEFGARFPELDDAEFIVIVYKGTDG